MRVRRLRTNAQMGLVTCASCAESSWGDYCTYRELSVGSAPTLPGSGETMLDSTRCLHPRGVNRTLMTVRDRPDEDGIHGPGSNRYARKLWTGVFLSLSGAHKTKTKNKKQKTHTHTWNYSRVEYMFLHSSAVLKGLRTGLKFLPTFLADDEGNQPGLLSLVVGGRNAQQGTPQVPQNKKWSIS